MAAIPGPDIPGFGEPGMGSTLGYAGAATGLLGGIVQAIGANQAAQGTAQAYEAQAAADRENAAIQGANAGQAWFATNRQLQQQQYRGNQIIGAQQAAYAAGGVSPAGGTPFDILADTEGQIKTQALNTFYTGKTAATNAGMQYTADEMAAAAADQAAQEAKDSATTGILGGILGGVGSALKIGTMFL